VQLLAVAIAVLVGVNIPEKADSANDGHDRTSALRSQMVRDQMEHPFDERQPVVDRRVLDAMRAVPRHLFVPEARRGEAYADRPLPIGEGQTISQPYIVGIMTELLHPQPDHVVLEVGTGSGYQAAVLALLVRHVYTIEIVKPLADRAQSVLEQLNYSNVTVRAGDGYAGWREHAPFDGIIVTAAPDHIPQPLVDQLRPGGRLIIPVGPRFALQHLLLITKTANGDISQERVMPVGFVPLTRDLK